MGTERLDHYIGTYAPLVASTRTSESHALQAALEQGSKYQRMSYSLMVCSVQVHVVSA